MKKYLLSFAVIASFVGFVFRQRLGAFGGVVNPNASGPTQLGTPSVTYKDGTYTGSVADAYYGYIQVQTVISRGKISDVQFLQYPNDRTNSIRINMQAMPYMKSEALRAQSANVNVITGATASSQAFVESLQSALSQAQV